MSKALIRSKIESHNSIRGNKGVVLSGRLRPRYFQGKRLVLTGDPHEVSVFTLQIPPVLVKSSSEAADPPRAAEALTPGSRGGEPTALPSVRSQPRPGPGAGATGTRRCSASPGALLRSALIQCTERLPGCLPGCHGFAFCVRRSVRPDNWVTFLFLGTGRRLCSFSCRVRPRSRAPGNGPLHAQEMNGGGRKRGGGCSEQDTVSWSEKPRSSGSPFVSWQSMGTAVGVGQARAQPRPCGKAGTVRG